MASNGNLELDCIATQQDTGTIYGIATASGTNSEGVSDLHVVLIRSSTSPSSLTSLTWSVVSTTLALDLSYVYPKFATVDCAVSSKGEFFALFPNNELLTTKSPTIPMGIRYDPDSNSWSSIRGSPMYGWNYKPLHQLFYTKSDLTTENNVESLVHLMADETGRVLRFGTVDTDTNMLQLADIWKRDRDEKEYSSGSFSDEFEKAANFPGMSSYGFYGGFSYADQRFFAPGSNQLYANIDTDDIIRVFPYTSAVRASRTSYQKAMYTIERNAYGLWTQNPVYNITGANSTGKFDVHQNMISAGGRLTGQEPFAVAVTTEGLYELQMFGPSAGNFTGPIRVTIPLSLYSSRPAEPIVFESDMLPIEEFGIVMGAGVAGVIAALYVKRWRRKRRQKQKDKERQSQESAAVVRDKSYMMGKIPESQTRPEAAIEINTSGGGRRSGEGGREFGSTTSSSVGWLPPNSASDYAYQDEIQGLELSSHPRPNIVTSVGDP
ncbi:hypothetical protein BGZ96_009719 [Linnemannia gamsii]|uniref:Acid protease n=1 Tax=Linnemannia gamsii TaxID=64522 RepID=A0ABQ7KD24_9FUNG|nr:hypothetical protein BGZ96_009719 [Linnemannia gamsii]